MKTQTWTIKTETLTDNSTAYNIVDAAGSVEFYCINHAAALHLLDVLENCITGYAT